MKIVVISNVPLENHLGSGYVINSFVNGFKKLGHNVVSYEPKDYIVVRFKFGARYVLFLSILICALKVYFRRKCDLLVFYGAESALAVSILKILPKRFLVVNNSNGLETNFEFNMQKYYQLLGKNINKRWYSFDLNSLLHLAFQNSDILVLNNKGDYNYALKEGYVNKNNLIYTDLGIDSEYLNLNIELASRREKNIVFCGSWIERKGINLIKKDVAFFLKNNSDYNLILIGVGNSFDLNEEFDKEIQSQIKVIGFLKDKSQIKNWLTKSQIFLFPSIYESFGLSLAEAMACGCCCVANLTGYATSLEHLKSIYLLSDLQSPSLYNALTELIKNPVLMDFISEGGHHRAQELKWDSIIEHIEHFYLNKLKKLG